MQVQLEFLIATKRNKKTTKDCVFKIDLKKNKIDFCTFYKNKLINKHFSSF